MGNPPWIRKSESLFKPETKNRGNSGEHAAIYKSYKWRIESDKFTKGNRCAWPECPVLATITDHIISIRNGGAIYDRRNWQPMCKRHHDKKSARERHGKIEPYIETPNGRIPERNKHLPPDIAGESYLVK